MKEIVMGKIANVLTSTDPMIVEDEITVAVLA